MTRMHNALLGLGLLLALVAAADPYDIKVYCAPRLDGIVLDGKVTEPAWQKAALVGGFTLYGKDTLAQPQTFFRVGYNEHSLLFAIVCNEPDMKQFAPVAQARDAHAVFSGETIEIFVYPKHSHSIYYQFAVNAAGSIYDSRGEDPVWNADIRAAAATEKDAWSLEVAIPWADLGVTPKPGLLLGFNVCRDRQIGAKQWTNWAHVIGGFHDPQRFAHIVLDGNAKTIGPYASELRKGDREGPIIVYTADGMVNSSYRALAAASLTALKQRLLGLKQEAKAETSTAVRQELGRLIARYQEKMKPIENALAANKTLDAREWNGFDVQLSQLERHLDDALWNARLKALLSEL